MNKNITFLLMLIFLSGCGTSRPVLVDKDTYMVRGFNTWFFTSGSGILTKLYTTAEQQCAAFNKVPSTKDKKYNNYAPFRPARAELVFQCLPKDNVDNKQPNVDDILKYKNLLDSGAITKEEYEQKKKQLLGL